MTTCCVPHIIATEFNRRKLFDNNGDVSPDKFEFEFEFESGSIMVPF